MGATAAQAEEVIRVFREKIDHQAAPVERKVCGAHRPLHPVLPCATPSSSADHFLRVSRSCTRCSCRPQSTKRR
jgi:hypothetical protein